MGKYIFKRFIYMLISLFIIITITFFLMKLMPGSPFNDAKLNAEQKEILNEKYGLAEGIDIHHLATDKRDRKKRVYDLLETVGLSKEHANRYPHEFSGGQRQRIGIARALAVEPEFIIADEPISALDVSIQAQVVNLLLKLQREKGITSLFIAYDLSMVKYISDRIAVMHFGKIVEIGPADDIYQYPLHDYTKSLLSAIPQPDPESERSRKRFSYIDDEANNHLRQLHEIRPQHFVFSTEEEAARLRKNLLVTHD